MYYSKLVRIFSRPLLFVCEKFSDKANHFFTFIWRYFYAIYKYVFLNVFFFAPGNISILKAVKEASSRLKWLKKVILWKKAFSFLRPNVSSDIIFLFDFERCFLENFFLVWNFKGGNVKCFVSDLILHKGENEKSTKSFFFTFCYVLCVAQGFFFLLLKII